MKKLLTVICLCLALFLALPGACSAKRSFDGDWYDSDGSLVVSIHDGYLNGCQILSTSNFVGGNPGGCAMRIVESSGYRDLHIMFYTYDRTGTHNYLVLENKTALRNTPEPLYYESVGGVYLGMGQKQLLSMYGRPNRVSKDTWYYDKVGFKVRFIGDIISSITFLRSGDRRLDRTGFNCTDSLGSYQEQYGLRRLPKVPTKSGFSDGTHSIGHGEYLNFDRYPYEVNLSIYYC